MYAFDLALCPERQNYSGLIGKFSFFYGVKIWLISVALVTKMKQFPVEKKIKMFPVSLDMYYV